ncbi:MAG: Gfo/Idh/MocA family oxidoreductase [Caldilineaceae bacterium]
MSNQQPIRVGFIGTGWTARVQIPMFRRGGLVVQAICSGNPANAQRVAQSADIPEVYADWQSLVAADTVDLVSIGAPPHLHAEIAIAALQAGKHVICEKPTALNVAEAETMLAAAQAAPNQLAIIDHELRFHPQRIHLRQLIRDGYVGEVMTLRLERLGGERLNPAAPWTWWHDSARGGGMLGAFGSHLIDLARWLSGRISYLTAQLQTGHYLRTDPATGRQREVTVDEAAHLLLQFSNQAQGAITVSGITPGGNGLQALVVGTRGALRLDQQERLWGAQGDDLHRDQWQLLETDFPNGEIADLIDGSPFTVGAYYLALRLAQALPAGETQLDEAASFYDGLVVQRALDAARRSHQEKIWVQL